MCTRSIWQKPILAGAIVVAALFVVPRDVNAASPPSHQVNRGGWVRLNPQPEPPSRPVYRGGWVNLSPQPEPPSRLTGHTLRNRPSPVGNQFQNALQKTSRQYGTMSNVLKQQHNVRSAMIRNVR